MIRTVCDGPDCGTDIDRDGANWYGVDHWLEADDDDDDPPGLLPDYTENSYHFCSPDCLSAWAFSKATEAVDR